VEGRKKVCLFKALRDVYYKRGMGRTRKNRQDREARVVKKKKKGGGQRGRSGSQKAKERDHRRKAPRPGLRRGRTGEKRKKKDVIIRLCLMLAAEKWD